MRRFFSLLIGLCLLLCGQSAQAGYVHFCTLPELVKKSDVLAVAEVVKIETLSNVDAPEVPMLRCRATLRVLRSFAPSGAVKLADEQTIPLEYETVDWSRISVWTGGFDFPYFRQGDIELLPLKAPAADATAWRLAARGEGYSIPATGAALADVQPADAYEFIAAEIAGALANGTSAQRNATAEYLSWANHGLDTGGNAAPLDAIDRLLSAHVNDEARWLDIFLALYAPVGWETPHAKIAELRAAPDEHDPRWFLAARALKHLNPQGLDERIIDTLVAQGEKWAYSTAETFTLNYPDDPRVARRVQTALEKSEPGALTIAMYLLSDRNGFPRERSLREGSVQLFKMLLPAALAAARRELTQPQVSLQVPSQTLDAACVLLAKFGSKADVAALVTEIERAQHADRVRYRQLVLAVVERQANTLPIWRVVLEDAALSDGKYWGHNWRYCDFAAMEIQRISKVDFGLKEPTTQLTLATRDQAIAKAKAWLAHHPAVEEPA